MIKAIVVDDEPIARAMMEAYVKRTPFLEPVGAFSNASDALEFMRSSEVDVAFLDIQMPEMNGLELSRLIDAKSTKIIFTTAFDKYALDGFRVDAVDYILKPISYDAFLRAASKAKDRIETERAARSAREEKPTSMFVKADYKTVKIDFDNIEFIESSRDYVVINTSDGQKITVQMTMKNMESQLPEDMFVRIHRSFIVNVSKVKVIQQGSVIFGRTVIPVSDSAKEKFYSLLSI